MKLWKRKDPTKDISNLQGLRGSSGYAAAVAAQIGSPGPPDDHVTGRWWHIDLISHLNSHSRLEDDDRESMRNDPNRFRAGDAFQHTTACPMSLAMGEHFECHVAGQDHERPELAEWAVQQRLIPKDRWPMPKYDSDGKRWVWAEKEPVA